MIIYNVTVNIEDSVHNEWLQWMKEVHIPEVLKTGLFSQSRLSKVLIDEEMGGQTYSIQYSCNSMSDYEKYEELYAPGLRQETEQRYKGKTVFFRTLLEVVEDFFI